ncbi:NAD(P)H-binding protein [Lysobacter maris]|uniref:NAD(P)H-binding protein n=1 Tax=Marilutibacter maris TaxID=1605891 RepID=A0A508A2P4_9GAMM|nr:NAD(P)H-binding protein [Lysobacter maris]KAB8164505.1 NAD(P)H-binding protein [Lysobacter maris]
MPLHATPAPVDGETVGSQTAGPRRVLVLGGAGFIGRHVAAALRERGVPVSIGSRHPGRRRRRADVTDAHYLRVRMERMTAAADWSALLAGVDAVINCVGILRPRGRETYDRVHHRAPAALAAACAARGRRLVHVSALGLDGPVRSRFLLSKRDGEAALRASGADWHIVRPSLLDGDGGYGARWIRRVARWPLQLLPADACGRIAVLDVADLGEAIANLVLAPADPGMPREHDLGGLRPCTLAEHVAAMRRLHTDAPAASLRVPGWLARLASHACDLLHLTPFSYGHWELLRQDNCPRRNRLPALLGRPPHSVGLHLPPPAPLPVTGAHA